MTGYRGRIARSLVNARESADVSQRELAERCALEPATISRLLDKMEGYLNHTQSEEFQKEYGDWSVILRVTLGREPDERILALLSKCPAWAEDYGVKLEIEIGGKPVRIVES